MAIDCLQIDFIPNIQHDYALVDSKGIVRDIACRYLVMSSLRSLGSRGIEGYSCVWFPGAMIGDIVPDQENLYEQDLCV
ncbi:MAG: hypothetical protein ACUZ8E_11975 [Candidatus Anammoxibacter sp.]